MIRILIILMITAFHIFCASAADLRSKLDTDDGSSKFVIINSSAVDIVYFDSEGNCYFSGEVGIGTTTPGTDLYVNGEAIISDALVIPQGAAPTVDAAGEIAVDTTDYVLLTWDGTAARVIAHPVFQTCFTIYSDGFWDNEAVPIWQAPKDMDVTIVQVNMTVMGSSTPNLVCNIEERPYASLAAAGTDIFADKTIDSNGEEYTAFTNAQIAAKAHLVFTTGAGAESSGTVDLITGVIYYLKNVE